MVLYHVTSPASAAALTVQGASQAHIGSGGGVQAGRAFYTAPSQETADYWLGRIGRADFVTVTVTLPDAARIASLEEVEARGGDAAIAWGAANGAIIDRYFSPALLAAFGRTRETVTSEDEEALLWHLMGLMLAAEGYDGFVSDWHTVVITNWCLLGPAAFAVPAHA